MKKFIIPLAAILIISESFTFHSIDERPAGMQLPDQADTNTNMTIILGDDFFRIDEYDSALTVRVGNRGLNILESLEGTKVDFAKYEKSSDDEREKKWDGDDVDDRDSFMKARHFRGHWAGIEAGFNNYNHISSMVLPDQIAYMSLDASNSNCFNLNFSQVNVGFGRHFGFVTGLGLNWNNYRFEHANSIIVDNDGIVSEYDPNTSVPVKRSKFSTLYMNIPALLEIQLPAGFGNSLNLAAGVIGGIKLNAWTKVVFEDGEKSRVNGDYNLNLLRGGFTARVGYRNFMLYGTYYLTPWFQEYKGPGELNLEPFEIGLAFTFND
jgi:hypothetical protein